MAFKTLTEMLGENAASHPGRVAVRSPDAELSATYGALDQLVDDVAAQLVARGVAPFDTVAIVADNCLEFVLALFGVILLRAVAAPLDPDAPPADRENRTAALQAKTTIVAEHLYDDFVATGRQLKAMPLSLSVKADDTRGTGVRATVAGPDSGWSVSPRSPSARSSPEDVALALFTSGTTDAPKIVPLTHANLLSSIAAIASTYELGSEDATVLVMPLFHGHGLIAGLLASLACGCSVHLPRGGRFHASRFWSEMQEAGATWYTAVPTMHQILVTRAAREYPRDSPPRLRFIRSCSAELSPVLQRELSSTFGAPVIQAYGMTETAHQVASNPLPLNGPDKPGSVGLPTGVEIRVASDPEAPKGSASPGEIWVRGPTVMAGYRENQGATNTTFTDGWFRTGDLGRLDADGYLFLTGRIKEIVNRGGEKISPARVDAVLESNPKVEEAVSFGVPDAKYGEELNAAVILQPGATVTEDELVEFCQRSLSPFEVPKKFFFVKSFPKTSKGTSDRRQVAAALQR